MVSVCGFAFVNNSVAGPASSGWGLSERCHVDDRRGEAEGQDDSDSRDVADIERESTRDGGGGGGGGLSCSNNPWASSNTSAAVEEPTDAISVRMSIWRDLCAGHQADERQVRNIDLFLIK